MPATWHRGPMAAFDIESTGINVETDHIVTTTVATVRPGEETAVSSWLIAVDIDIPATATAIHGITTEHARINGKPAAEVLDVAAGELALALTGGVPVVGMNLAYDFTILDRGLRRCGLPTLPERLGGPIGPVIDVYVLDQQIEPRITGRRKAIGKRKLTDLCQVYGVRIDGAHDATFDAIAAARIAWRIGRLTEMSVDELVTVYADRAHPTATATRVEALGRMSLAELHAAQIGWRQQQCDSLRRYFDLNHISHDGVRGDWPLIPYQPAGRPS